ncbi:MAG: GIY-YIG nuclease family protein [Ignavibacteriae bacterium]|nr:GIY-YIG nuclease family protein [Ignavibacteriota bacterium]
MYVLEISIKSKLVLNHKILGELELNKGYYYYVGSAQRNLTQRVERHLRKDKKLHWHIDYLTTHPKVKIKNTYLIPNKDKNEECKLVKKLEQNFDCSHAIKGFGNSDCNVCISHLLFRKEKITFRKNGQLKFVISK